MTKSSIIKCVLSLLLAAYLCVALSMTSRMAASDTCEGLIINVVDSAKRGFVKSEDIRVDLGPLAENIRNITHDSLNTLLIEQQIMARDNIEKATCQVLNSGKVRIDVTPLIPVARVFDYDGTNYYINRAGKHMQASTRHRMDVPVIFGHFGAGLDPSVAFPLIDHVAGDKSLSALTSAVEVRRNGDLILIPSIKGHVVNMGDTNDLANKFDRLTVFYRRVMPAKGWEYYDTISVKWRGQVVAKRRHGQPKQSPVIIEEYTDLDDESTMLTTQTQPQT